MTPQQCETAIRTVAGLGEIFRRGTDDAAFASALEKAAQANAWFTPENIRRAVRVWGEALTEQNIRQWIGKYPLSSEKYNVLLVLAGNIPMVGLHDILCTYLSGHRAIVKPSKDDTALIAFVTDFLKCAEPSLADNLMLTHDIVKEGIGAVVATGGDNAARYFEYYFRDIPAILRHSRYSVGVIGPGTTDEELSRLADDILLYFGLGCRSVSSVLVPEGFEMQRLCRALEKHAGIALHHKYKSNYDYRRAMCAMSGRAEVYDTGFTLLVPAEGLGSPLGTVGYRRYTHPDEVKEYIRANSGHIQCVVGEGGIAFGSAQNPSLEDYADGEDTMDFLSSRG